MVSSEPQPIAFSESMQVLLGGNVLILHYGGFFFQPVLLFFPTFFF